MVPPETSVLIVRAWVEGEPPVQLRARMIRIVDVTRPDEQVSTATTVEEVLQAVRLWLEELLARGPGA